LGHSITTVLFDADGVIQTPEPGWLDRVADLKASVYDLKTGPDGLRALLGGHGLPVEQP
jgi:hypothetical protein